MSKKARVRSVKKALEIVLSEFPGSLCCVRYEETGQTTGQRRNYREKQWRIYVMGHRNPEKNWTDKFSSFEGALEQAKGRLQQSEIRGVYIRF